MVWFDIDPFSLMVHQAYIRMMVLFDMVPFSLMVAILYDASVKEITAFFVIDERLNPTPCL